MSNVGGIVRRAPEAPSKGSSGSESLLVPNNAAVGKAAAAAKPPLLRASTGSQGAEPELKLRVDQPVENVECKAYAYITGTGPPDASKTSWKWMRSSEAIACSNSSCKSPYKDSEATIESVCFATNRRFCSVECFKMAWAEMREKVSMRHLEDLRNENEADEDLIERVKRGSHVGKPSSPWGDMTWTQVSASTNFVPTADEVGRLLRIEVASEGLQQSVQTPIVIPMPLPPPERRYLMNPQQPAPQMLVGNERIRVVTYNLLAPIYATQSQYPYCPMWALSWNFRKNLIIRELTSFNADILCLQEVQTDQFESFLLPQLKRLGYEGLNKQKTREAMGPKGRVDGCALFFKTQRFTLTAKFVIEFNDAAINMAKAGKFSNISAEQANMHAGHSNQQGRSMLKNAGLGRLLKDNVAQIAVLEMRDPYGQYAYAKHPPRICVSNVHCYWDPAFADVKLWQTHVLIKELEKYTMTNGLPLLLAGDFNSEPGSSVHELLRSGRVPQNHEDLRKDTCNILPPLNKLVHSIPLRSAYASVRGGSEPQFTNYTASYKGTLDYLWYGADQLLPVAILDIPNEKELVAGLKGGVALPSAQYPSDHLSLCCDFGLLRGHSPTM